jgi:microcystin-dependent protein
MLIEYVGHTIPDDLVEAYGQSLSSTDYAALYAAMVKSNAVTLTLGSPGTVNWTSHGLNVNSKVRFTTSGALPTGLTPNTDYYISSSGFTANSFRVSATAGGTAIAFTGSQSGTQTAIHAQFGVANDLSTFSVPDFRGRVAAGFELMGGTSADRLTGITNSVNGEVLGATGGREGEVLDGTQVPSHTHPCDPPNPVITVTGVTINSGGAHVHGLGSHYHSFNVDSNIASQSSVVGVSYSGNFQGGGNKNGIDGHTLSNGHRHNVAGNTGGGIGTTDSGGAHTHTASATATATLADFNTGENAGGGQAHNNVQPTLIVRKLIYTG